MFNIIWKLLVSSWGKLIFPIIKFILIEGKYYLKLYSYFKNAFDEADKYEPPLTLKWEMAKEGFDALDNYKRLCARKWIVFFIERENIKIKDLYLDILLIIYYYTRKYKLI